MNEVSDTIEGPHGAIAYRRVEGAGPVVVWLGGFKSDMTGTKAEAIARWADMKGRAFLRFDYSGHGASAGRFADGTISAWLADAMAAIEALTEGRLVLVGSSMGGWIAALAALQMPERLAGLVLIAPAPDFTEALMWNAFSPDDRTRLMRDGFIAEASEYSEEPTIITRALIEDGRSHLLMNAPVNIECRVKIIQGMKDPDVPWGHAHAFANLLVSKDVELTLIKEGDHPLSKPQEIATIIGAIESI